MNSKKIFQPKSSGWTVTGHPKSVVATTEPVDRGRNMIQSTAAKKNFQRSPAPSPPDREERKQGEKKVESQSSSKSKSKSKTGKY